MDNDIYKESLMRLKLRGKLTESMVQNAVLKGWITQAEADEMAGAAS